MGWTVSGAPGPEHRPRRGKGGGRTHGLSPGPSQCDRWPADARTPAPPRPCGPERLAGPPRSGKGTSRRQICSRGRGSPEGLGGDRPALGGPLLAPTPIPCCRAAEAHLTWGLLLVVGAWGKTQLQASAAAPTGIPQRPPPHWQASRGHWRRPDKWAWASGPDTPTTKDPPGHSFAFCTKERKEWHGFQRSQQHGRGGAQPHAGVLFDLFTVSFHNLDLPAYVERLG